MLVSSDYSGATTLTQITLKFTIIVAKQHYVECHFVECCYAECRGALEMHGILTGTYSVDKGSGFLRNYGRT